MAQGADVVGKIVQPQRTRKVAQVFEQPMPVGQIQQSLHPILRQAGGDEVLGTARLVHGDDQAVACAGEHAGAVDSLLQHDCQVEARADAQDGRAQRGDVLPVRLDLGIRRVRIGHCRLLVESAAGPFKHASRIIIQKSRKYQNKTQ